MKNTIYIDIDTDREQPILIGKGEENAAPTNREEAGTMILTDISSICDALIALIHVADHNQYGDKETLVNQSINELNKFLKLPTETNTVEEATTEQ